MLIHNNEIEYVFSPSHKSIKPVKVINNKFVCRYCDNSFERTKESINFKYCPYCAKEIVHYLWDAIELDWRI